MENDNFTSFLRNIEMVAKSFTDQIDTLRKVTESMTSGIRAVQEVGKSIAKFFEKNIYLNPELYTTFLELKIAISQEEIKKGIEQGTLDPDDIYSVYTIDENSSKLKMHSFKVTKDVAKAIRLLIRNKPQFMYIETENIEFDDEGPKLIINGYPVPLTRESDRYYLCKYMFGRKDKRRIPWSVKELVDVLGKDYTDTSIN
jgi:citrate lyase gamma subunit